MQVLLSAATPFEIAPVIAWLEKEFEQQEPARFKKDNLTVELCVTGIGILVTSWRLAGVFGRQKPDLAINAGIAGAIDKKLQLGDVVHVTEETLADLGVEAADGSFIDLFELGFSRSDEFPFTGGKLLNPGVSRFHFLPTAVGITLNKAHGAAASIEQTLKKYPNAQVESMEGAAFFYACLITGVNFMELRAVSNYVEPRNREAWNIPFAIQNLNQVLEQMLKSLMD